MHNEFVVEFKDGTRDWVDPVESFREDTHLLYITNFTGNVYEFNKVDVKDWLIRPYDTETTYDWIGASSNTYTGTGSDYLDCVLGVGGFEKYGPITGHNWVYKAIDQLDKDYDEGFISHSEYNQSMRELMQEVEEYDNQDNYNRLWDSEDDY